MKWAIHVVESFAAYGPTLLEGFLYCEWEGTPPLAGETVGPLVATDAHGMTWEVPRAIIVEYESRVGARVFAKACGPFRRTDLAHFELATESVIVEARQ